MRVAKPRVDVLGHARLLKIGQRRLTSSRVVFECDEPSAGPAQRPRDPDARMARRCTDLEGTPVALLHDEIVKRAAVYLRHVQVVPAVTVTFEERFNPGVERR